MEVSGISYRSQRPLHYSAVSHILRRPFGTWPTSCGALDKKTFLLTAQCSSVVSVGLLEVSVTYLSYCRATARSHKASMLNLKGDSSPTLQEVDHPFWGGYQCLLCCPHSEDNNKMVNLIARRLPASKNPNWSYGKLLLKQCATNDGRYNLQKSTNFPFLLFWSPRPCLRTIYPSKKLSVPLHIQITYHDDNGSIS